MDNTKTFKVLFMVITGLLISLFVAFIIVASCNAAGVIADSTAQPLLTTFIGVLWLLVLAIWGLHFIVFSK